MKKLQKILIYGLCWGLLQGSLLSFTNLSFARTRDNEENTSFFTKANSYAASCVSSLSRGLWKRAQYIVAHPLESIGLYCMIYGHLTALADTFSLPRSAPFFTYPALVPGEFLEAACGKFQISCPASSTYNPESDLTWSASAEKCYKV